MLTHLCARRDLKRYWVSGISRCSELGTYPKKTKDIFGNYSCMLIGLPIAIMYFLARKITAEGAEERYKHLTIYFPSAYSAVIFPV